MGTPFLGTRKRRPHYWKLRAEGARELFIKHGWGLCGGYARKTIRGREVMMTVASKGKDFCLYCFEFKADRWADIAMAARCREARERRSSFRLVEP